MNALKTAALALPFALLAGTAGAQTKMVEIEDDQTQVPAMNVTVDQLDDMDVYDADNKKIGEVEEVLGTDAQTPSAVAIDFDRALDEDDMDRIVELSELEKSGDLLKLSIDAAAVKELPTYND